MPLTGLQKFGIGLGVLIVLIFVVAFLYSLNNQGSTVNVYYQQWKTARELAAVAAQQAAATAKTAEIAATTANTAATAAAAASSIATNTVGGANSSTAAMNAAQKQSNANAAAAAAANAKAIANAALKAKTEAEKATYDAAVALAATCADYEVVKNSKCVYKCDDNALIANGQCLPVINLNQYEVVDRKVNKVVCADGSAPYTYADGTSRCVPKKMYSFVDNNYNGDDAVKISIPPPVDDATCANMLGKSVSGYCEVTLAPRDPADPNNIWLTESGKGPANGKLGNIFSQSGWMAPTTEGGEPVWGGTSYDVYKGPMIKGVSVAPAVLLNDAGVPDHPNFSANPNDPNYKKVAVSYFATVDPTKCVSNLGGYSDNPSSCYLQMFNYSDTTAAANVNKTGKANASYDVPYQYAESAPFKTANSIYTPNP
jgi:hypothetical protein